MNPQETEELTAFIREIREQFGLTIFLIEHHMNLVMDISDRIYVIDFGTSDRRRRSGGNSERSARHRRIFGGGRGWSNILEIKNLVVSYGGIEAVKGIDLTCRRGQDRDARRLERRRQIHDAQIHRGA